MIDIAEVIAKVETARSFFADSRKEREPWDWAHESLIACDLLLTMLRWQPPDPNHCAFLARLIRRTFRWSHPRFLPEAANLVLEWARAQPDTVRYKREHGIHPFVWKTDAP